MTWSPDAFAVLTEMPADMRDSMSTWQQGAAGELVDELLASASVTVAELATRVRDALAVTSLGSIEDPYGWLIGHALPRPGGPKGVPLWCRQCDPAGEHAPAQRKVETQDGKLALCRCHPQHPDQLTRTQAAPDAAHADDLPASPVPELAPA